MDSIVWDKNPVASHAASNGEFQIRMPCCKGAVYNPRAGIVTTVEPVIPTSLASGGMGDGERGWDGCVARDRGPFLLAFGVYHRWLVGLSVKQAGRDDPGSSSFLLRSLATICRSWIVRPLDSDNLVGQLSSVLSVAPHAANIS
ncbi:uncharacterized protein BO96DRAFT_405262 [Aspergillus niger CBS 101883]|uniref:Uncharacterized protein n=2 Tax=Aspergillus niger TaxID=5061 RepID=A2Q8L8_ASPNC|nr:uncharacterized protein BO96DRAFT_405262 [Aspergillus niger CBS 101883]XP_059599643.1 hypothetical protein An01g04810 [Aspergillus niger]PYH50823.1 hypothetical protein BO96DRAFT_405262 [Aspergillus niger CBS 101883]CAK37015.1 hypothetical protein An01g04810 [Aspergillus niger]